jgi:hypothetical protein
MAAGLPLNTPTDGRDRDCGSESPTLKARQLLCEILPPAQRQQLLDTDAFYHVGQFATYRIRRGFQTELYRNGQVVARACLQLTIPSPCYDRMIAEYLILHGDEGLYWKKANILPTSSPTGAVPIILLVVLSVALLTNLVVTYAI